MLRKVTLAIAAAATLSAVALAPTAASAWHPKHIGHHHHHHGHHHHGHHHHGFGFKVGYFGGGYDGCYVSRRVFTPYGVVFRTVNICY
ncbi:hypothetical protein LJR220_006594 [Bradyrhizobium sp. LjRoot220]|uniref:hypothetical protein n=1 Tax=Bradyrhizobium sp. LjRoot220 TaxID=3342284 RepID=UPI003ECF9A23